MPQQEAFKVSTEIGDKGLEVQVAIADGYYLYKDRVATRTVAGGAELGKVQLPDGKIYSDEFFGETEIYRDNVSFFAAATLPEGAGDHLFEVVIQGCADAGVCYPPYVTRHAFSQGGGTGTMVAGDASLANVGFAPPVDNTGGLVDVLNEGSIWLVVFLFFNAGLLLSFTPCVLPMVPIATTIVTGGATPGGRRAIALGISYVLGMAMIYTLIGLLVARSGSTFLTGSLQSPYILIPMSLAFLSLAVVMYRNINFALVPSSVRQRLAAVSCRPGTHPGALLAGGVSAIVVSPCVAVPLVGALIFIATTGDASLGALALFSMSLGMGVLPLAVAAGAGSFLPKTGPISEAVKKFFALAMAALAIWVLGSLVPPSAKLLGYGVLGLVAAKVLVKAAFEQGVGLRGRWISTTAAFCLAIFSGVLLLGGATGAQNELTPLAHLFEDDEKITFQTVVTEAEFQAALDNTVNTGNKGTFEYYYADWCVSCRELEGYTFKDPDLIAAIKGYKPIKVDLTATGAESRRLLAKANLFGPPAVIVRDASGMKRLRYVGYIESSELVEAIQSL